MSVSPAPLHQPRITMKEITVCFTDHSSAVWHGSVIIEPGVSIVIYDADNDSNVVHMNWDHTFYISISEYEEEDDGE